VKHSSSSSAVKQVLSSATVCNRLCYKLASTEGANKLLRDGMLLRVCFLHEAQMVCKNVNGQDLWAPNNEEKGKARQGRKEKRMTLRLLRPSSQDFTVRNAACSWL